MQLYPKLSPENIKKLCNKYLSDCINDRNFQIKGTTVFIPLNYHCDSEYYPVGKIFKELNQENIDGFIDFFNRLMEGKT